MYKNYFKIAWRNLVKYKEQSIIHILGLTLGLTGSILIGLFVLDELRFDTFHPDTENTYRIFSERNNISSGETWASTSPAFGSNLRSVFPEVTETLRLFRIRTKQLFVHDGESSLEEKGVFAEPAIFDFFHLPLIHGDPATALNQINSIVLSYPTAKKYFGDSNPVGQTISINETDKEITGVLQPLNKHFHLDFNFLVSFENLIGQVSEARINSWVWQDFYNYIRLTPGTDIAQFQDKLLDFTREKAHPQTAELGFTYFPFLQRIDDIYLHSANFRNDIAKRGDYRYFIGLSLVGLFLILIACINFINLTTARALHRSKEVGIRKATGASRHQLAFQFICEGILTVAVSMLVATQLIYLFIPYLNDFTGKALAFDWYKSPLIILSIIGIILITGLLAGGYPALVLSGFRPVEALNGSKYQPSGHVRFLRKGLVTLQFTLSIILIISVIIIFKQVNFLNKKDLGFKKERLVHFPMKKDLFRDFDATKNEFLKVPGVIAASTCFGIPGDIVSGDNIIVPGENRRTLPARIFNIDHEFIATMKMEIIAGRDFSKNISTDATEAFILNEKALHNLSIADSPEEAIGMNLEWEGWDENNTIKKGRIIGVVKDFHYNSLHEEVETAILHIYPDAYWKLALRIDGSELTHTIAGIKNTWDNYNTGFPLDYQFVDAGLGAMYEAEEKLNTMLWIFTILAVIISCIGAFGLAAYSTEKRMKEIGIRKVLGASTQHILVLLTRDFVGLVVIALLIASPFAWYFMNKWLAEFAYRIDIQWWVFIIAGLLTVAIALFTIGFQSLKAALTNPIESLRSE